jgi:hypothetical protein
VLKPSHAQTNQQAALIDMRSVTKWSRGRALFGLLLILPVEANAECSTGPCFSVTDLVLFGGGAIAGLLAILAIVLFCMFGFLRILRRLLFKRTPPTSKETAIPK